MTFASQPFVDIHCHLLPGIDDGAADLDASLAMARMAVENGTGTVIVTPHQLGAFAHNQGDAIRSQTLRLQQALRDAEIPLEVLPGADVRIETGMLEGLREGHVLTLADRRKHVLLELPHELYLPLEPLLQDLNRCGLTGILSHPERNGGLLRKRSLLEPLVEAGCLMQVTAGSLTGTFGPDSQELAQWMLQRGLVHFIASDGHSPRHRRPRLQKAYQRTAMLCGEAIALQLCCTFPRCVAAGESIPAGRLPPPIRSGWRSLLLRRRAA